MSVLHFVLEQNLIILIIYISSDIKKKLYQYYRNYLEQDITYYCNIIVSLNKIELHLFSDNYIRVEKNVCVRIGVN